MLVLSRQRDESIRIGEDIEVTVVDIRGDKVRLGINAPKDVSVHREEVYLAIRRENRVASASAAGDGTLCAHELEQTASYRWHCKKCGRYGTSVDGKICWDPAGAAVAHAPAPAGEARQ